MKPATAETILTWLLRLDGVVMSLAIIPVFFPDALMYWIHERIGLEEMPTDPITEYLARSCSMLYALHGAIILYISRRPRDYWNLIRWILLLHMILGIVLFGVDLNAGLPVYWIAGEGLPIAALATFMFWLWLKASERSLPAESTTTS